MHLYLNSVCREIWYLPMALVKEIKGSINAIFIFLDKSILAIWTHLCKISSNNIKFDNQVLAASHDCFCQYDTYLYEM